MTKVVRENFCGWCLAKLFGLRDQLNNAYNRGSLIIVICFNMMKYIVVLTLKIKDRGWGCLSYKNVEKIYLFMLVSTNQRSSLNSGILDVKIINYRKKHGYLISFYNLKPWPQTYDGYSTLHTQLSMYLNGGILSVECES